MVDDQDVPIRELTSGEADLVHELLGARRAIVLLTEALQQLAMLHADHAPSAVERQIVTLEAEMVTLRSALQAALRDQQTVAAHHESTLTAMDATMRQLLLARDELVRATGR